MNYQAECERLNLENEKLRAALVVSQIENQELREQIKRKNDDDNALMERLRPLIHMEVKTLFNEYGQEWEAAQA